MNLTCRLSSRGLTTWSIIWLQELSAWLPLLSFICSRCLVCWRHVHALDLAEPTFDVSRLRDGLDTLTHVICLMITSTNRGRCSPEREEGRHRLMAQLDSAVVDHGQRLPTGMELAFVSSLHWSPDVRCLARGHCVTIFYFFHNKLFLFFSSSKHHLQVWASDFLCPPYFERFKETFVKTSWRVFCWQ